MEETGSDCSENFIDDTSAALDKTWSSEKIQKTITGKQVAMEVLYSGLAAKIGKYNLAKSANQYSMLMITTPGDQNQIITRIPGTGLVGTRIVNKWSSDYQIWLQLNLYETYFEIRSSSVGTGWGFNGIY